MTALLHRLARLLPALWLGLVLTVGAIAAPAAFAALPRELAGAVVGQVFAREAMASLLLGALLLLAERARVRREGGPQFTLTLGLVLGAVACTVVGYYAIQPQMQAARAGASALTFGQWHGVSLALFALKGALLAWLALRGR